ncbi:MAG: SCP2 sterol-binding domain-containing protein [Firmicutes bacterium]|nr:SCP2 sterol-binding domain-containing protein [Bacillota bacterium]
MTVEDVINDLIQKLDQAPPELTAIEAIFELNITGGQAATYQLKIEKRKLAWAEGTPYKPSCIIYISDEDFLKIASGELNPKVALLTGRVRIEGDFSQALALSAIIKKYH